MKRYLSGMLAIVIAVSVAAFTKPPKTHPDSLQWYVLTTGADPAVASNYTLNSTTPPGQDPACPSTPSAAVCSINANPGSGNHPSASDLAAIKSASSNFTTTNSNLEYKH